ncbi:hypothetical protein ASE12_01065 [Aeromicrobium sp. Root236]|uniref:hypothetical protein n=1 Tax=Aeromicrobium sp. Root236 TaxID=1736498 RepID=UPI0006FC4040|nr:hypothetical protein [Aeromicrobium sp. Root236]KRC63472.1 hypothetical protein ASE12_01065 [Aeromicrobium sp. Root236]
MRIISQLLGTGIVATALVSAVATSAVAQETTVKDLRADVVQYSVDDDLDPGTILDGPTSIATGIDATSARVKHTKKSVAIQMRFADLTTDKTFTYAGIRVRGAKTWPSYWVQSNGSKTKGAVYDRNFKRLCSATFTTRSGESGWINVVVPRSCINKPKEIKVKVWVVREPQQDPDDVQTFLEESVSPTTYKSASWTTWLKSS